LKLLFALLVLFFEGSCSSSVLECSRDVVDSVRESCLRTKIYSYFPNVRVISDIQFLKKNSTQWIVLIYLNTKVDWKLPVELDGNLLRWNFPDTSCNPKYKVCPNGMVVQAIVESGCIYPPCPGLDSSDQLLRIIAPSVGIPLLFTVVCIIALIIKRRQRQQQQARSVEGHELALFEDDEEESSESHSNLPHVDSLIISNPQPTQAVSFYTEPNVVMTNTHAPDGFVPVLQTNLRTDDNQFLRELQSRFDQGY